MSRRQNRLPRFSLLAVAVAVPLACADGTISGAGQPGPGGGPSTPGGGGPGRPITGMEPTQSNGWFEALKAADCSKEPALPQSRVWRLSAPQWKATVEQALSLTGVDVARFPKDEIDPRTGFSADAADNRVTLPLATAYFDITDEVATRAAPAALTAFACLGTAPVDAACAQRFVADYGQRLFRRPLAAEETSGYVAFLTAESRLDPAATAVSSLLRAMMMSPNFLYRTEMGSSKAGPIELTGHEIASLLSYTIADAPPDAALLQAAASGKLTDPAVREGEARRLMATPAARAKLTDFWRQYLGRSEIPAGDGIDAALAAAMIKETEGLFDRVVWDKPGGLNELLTAKYSYAEPRVAAIYGAATPGADGRVALNPAERSGFLTHASFLVGTATPSQASTVIHRGLLVRERLLCLQAPPLPANFVPDPAQVEQAGPDATARENYELFARTMPACNACHSAFQPVGLAFESYDKLGHYRKATDSGKPILTGGELLDAGDATGPYTDVVGMAGNIGKSQISGYCFSKQFAQFALGRSVSTDEEACTIRAMGDHVAGKGGALRELYTSLAHLKTAYRRFHQ